MNKTIYSTDYRTVIAETFEVLVDDNKERGQVIGLLVEPVDGEPFILPVSFPAAKEIAMNIAKVLMFTAPDVLGI